jgi:tetratricopeptide (TPR) repeat protein
MPAKKRSRPPPRDLPKPSPPNDLWIYLLVLVATLAVYAQVRDHDFVNYDDPIYVTGNLHVRNGVTAQGLAWAFTSAYDANWFPLTWISHMLDCQVFGLRSGAHHLTNLALHTMSSLLLYALLKRMTGARWRSAFVALVFALHPLHVESVAWVAERKDVLCALFWLLTLWCYLNYIEQRTAWRYLLLLLAFCCGLMSKPMIVTLPFVLLLLDVWPLHRGPLADGRGSAKAAEPRLSGSGVLLEKLPLFALSIAASIVTFMVQQRGGTVSSIGQIPIHLRVENALVSYVVYIVKLFWPAKLAVFYPYSNESLSWQGIAAGLGLAAVTALVLRAVAPRPYLAVGWLWYLGTLLPVIGLVQVGDQSRADRYTYVPMIGISIMLAWGIAELFERRGWGKTALAALGVAVCSAWAVVAWINLEYWQNSISLFQHAVEVTDGNYIAYSNLGAALRQDGRPAEAVAEFQNAVRIRPQEAEAQDNLGEALLTLGRTGEAIPPIMEAIRLKPGFAKAHVDLGSALIEIGRADEAAAQYSLALQLQPDSPEAHYGLGGVLVEQGRMEEALPHLQAAIPHLVEKVRANPDDVDGHYNLGRLFGIMGRTDEAIAQFSETVRLRPEDAEAHYNLGIAFTEKQRLKEAVDQFSAAVQLRPDYVKAHFQRGKALEGLGRTAEAREEFSLVRRLDPNFADK